MENQIEFLEQQVELVKAQIEGLATPEDRVRFNGVNNQVVSTKETQIKCWLDALKTLASVLIDLNRLKNGR